MLQCFVNTILLGRTYFGCPCSFKSAHFSLTCWVVSLITFFYISIWLLSCLDYITSPGWVLPYLGIVGRFRGDEPHVWDFQSSWVPILYLNTILLNPLFCRKKLGLSLSHLVPDILGRKVSLIVHHLVLFNRFLAFCIKFLLDFRSN